MVGDTAAFMAAMKRRSPGLRVSNDPLSAEVGVLR